MTEALDNAVVELFEANIEAFIRTGSPLVFGRIEAIKDVLEIYQRTEGLKAVKALLAEHHDHMAAQCDSR